MKHNLSLATAAFLFGLGCALPTWAQQAAPPTELEVEHNRAIAAEGQSVYVISVLRKQQAEFAAQRQADSEKASQTAAWWTEVWKALPRK